MFHPLREDYPPFYVTAKKREANNVFAIVNYEHWETKWPRGGIQSVIGVVGDPIAERKAVLQAAAIPRKATAEGVRGSFENHSNDSWDYVCNIDPVGCQDVDDVFAWRVLNDGSTEFAIAIADVSAWIAEGSPLDLEARLSATTLYDDGEAVAPMFPTEISAEKASLRADGCARPTLALIYTLRDGALIRRFEQCMMTVSESHTYDSVLNSPHSETLRKYLTIVLDKDVGNDSHIWVKCAMIEYNRYSASLLKSAGVGLLRAHSGRIAEEWKKLATITGCAELEWLGSAAGKYVNSSGEETDVRHNGLGLDAYAHASSPLRRYADLVNQRWLKYIVFNQNAVVQPVDAALLNARCSAIKQVERTLWFLKHADLRTITTVNAFVIGIKPDHIQVYCPFMRRRFRCSTQDSYSPGDAVVCRIFCNLNKCTERFVVQASKV